MYCMFHVFMCIIFQEQFGNWLVDDHDCLQLSLVQNALFSYQEISSHIATKDEEGKSP